MLNSHSSEKEKCSTYIVEEEGEADRGWREERILPEGIAEVSNGERKELTGVDIAVTRSLGEGFEGFHHRRRPENGGGSKD